MQPERARRSIADVLAASRPPGSTSAVARTPRNRLGGRGGRARLVGCLLAPLLALGAAGCERPPDEALAPLQHLVEHQEGAVPSAALERGRYVALNEVSRPTLAASRPFRVTPECQPGEGFAPGPCAVRVPAELADVPWLLVEVTPAATASDAHDVRSTRFLQRAVDGGRVALPHGFAPRAVRRVELRGLPSLAAREVVTGPLSVPPGARLRFAIAAEAPAWLAGTAPVEFTIAAVGERGTRRLFRRTLDPANQADDRGWSEADVDLDAVAGETVRLRFSSRATDPSDARPALPVWADPTLWAPRTDDARPSIVLLSLDTLRARSMSTYGYGHETTPYLTSLARGGALFERAFTTFSNTLGSHMSMMTGLYPPAHGVVALDRPLAPAHATLAEVLRGAGYATAAFTENGLLEGSLGFERGFGLYAANKGVFSAAGDAPGTFGRAVAWVRRHARTPFFLFVHTYAVHLPYAPPRAYADLFTDGTPAETRTPVERERLRYEQEVRALDDDVKHLIAALDEVVPDERLLLIVTSDHGEEFGEHGQITHLQLYEEVLHIPLVVRLPGRVAAGTRIAAPVSLIDLAPTVLEFAGARALPGDGTSLATLLRTPGTALQRGLVFAQSLPYDVTGKQWRFIARSADEKCILPEHGPSECFDVAADPDERRSLAPDDRASLAALHREAEAYRTRALASIGAAGAQPIAEGTNEVDAATQRKLRALGYAD